MCVCVCVCVCVYACVCVCVSSYTGCLESRPSLFRRDSENSIERRIREFRRLNIISSSIDGYP